MSKSLGMIAETTQKTVKSRRGEAPLSPEELDDQVRKRLNELPQLDRKALQKLWLELFGVRPHPHLRRELLMMVLTYRIQEHAYGGLKPSTRKKLLSHAEGFDKDAEAVGKLSQSTKPGTRIVREWGSKLHEVTVLESGFDYDGMRFGSLSEIARKITGTRWSGPAFFGLKKRARAVTA